jgi:glycosyltransferase involved in cell wall biosynthesis
MKPFVSILIPCFNAERWIQQAVESALAQTWPHKEIIVVDDGSMDRSAEIISGFGERIRFERSPNRGGNATRNRLLELAQGDWLQYLDADDYLKPEKIASQVSGLEIHPDVDVLFGPSIVEWHANDATRVTLEEIPEPHDRWILLALWRLPQTGAPLWRKSALQEVGGWSVNQPCCQEHDLYLRLLIAGKRFMYFPATGSVYRRFADGSVSTRDPALVRRERLKIEKRLEDHLKMIGELTPDRHWAINQGRFDMARIAWNVDRSEARAIVATIATAKSFRPVGPAAPPLYRLAYRLFGFEMAERLATINRVAFRPSQQAVGRGLRDAAD